MVQLALEAGPTFASAPEPQVGGHALSVVSLDVIQFDLLPALRASHRQGLLALQHVILDFSCIRGLETEDLLKLAYKDLESNQDQKTLKH